MRQKLIQYVGLLFEGAPDSEDMHQEILQNTLDRYDDLVAQGHSPESAYRLAIAGIGDIASLLQGREEPPRRPVEPTPQPVKAGVPEDSPVKKTCRAAALLLFLLSPLPLLILEELDMDMLGLCGLLTLAAVGAGLMTFGSSRYFQEDGGKRLLRALGVGLFVFSPVPLLATDLELVGLCGLLAICAVAAMLYNLSGDRPKARPAGEGRWVPLLWLVALAVYLFISFDSGAWYMTWLIFPLAGAVQGLVRAIGDLKEET